MSLLTFFSTDVSHHRIAVTGEIPGAFSVNWFIQLRWVAVLGQIFTVLGSRLLFEINLMLQPLVITIVITALSNFALMAWYYWRSHQGPIPGSKITWTSVMGMVMGVDLMLLTALLYFSGGPSNPFWIFYFVNLCLAGIELSAISAWCLNFLAICCFGFLLFDHYPLDVDVLSDFLPSIRTHQRVTLAHNGMFCAFSTCATVLIFFTTLVTSKLRQRETQLRVSEKNRSRGEKLEALGTLAAGAAHELATPLSNIALVVHELSRELDQITDDDHVHDDVDLIRNELNRCRHILNQMSAQAGQASIESPEKITVSQLKSLILSGPIDLDRVNVKIHEGVAATEVLVQPDQVSQALRGMVKNALEATSLEKSVRCEFQIIDRSNKHYLDFSVTDEGEGIPQEVLNRMGEPFFTTKETGKGMGLGIFLARTVLERMGGQLNIESKPGVGTKVISLIPVDLNPKSL